MAISVLDREDATDGITDKEELDEGQSDQNEGHNTSSGEIVNVLRR